MTFRYYTAQQRHLASDLTPCWICHEDFAVGEWLGEHRCSHFAHLECLGHLRDSVPAQEHMLNCLCGARLPKTLLPEGSNTREREGLDNTQNAEDEGQGEVESELNVEDHTSPAPTQPASAQPASAQPSSEPSAQPAPEAVLTTTQQTPEDHIPRNWFVEEDWEKTISQHQFKLGDKRRLALNRRRGQLFTLAWNDLFIDTSPDADAQDMMLIMGEIHMAEFERPLRRIKRLFFWQNAKTPLTDIAMAVYTMAYKDDEPYNYHKMGMIVEIDGVLGYFDSKPAKNHIGHGGTFVLRLPPCSF
ncbi:hypothetical protein IWZ01DRAFT_31195 [Phyllosticta capitalensis]